MSYSLDGLPDGVLVVRLRRRVLECPERAGLTEASLLPELLVVEVGAVRSRHRQLAGLLVGELGQDVVLEPLDVLPAELVQVPDAVVVQPLGVEAQHLDDGHRAGVEPLREHTECSRVSATQGGDQVCRRHVRSRDAVLRRAVHFFALSSSGYAPKRVSSALARLAETQDEVSPLRSLER